MNAVDLSPDGRLAITGSTDRNVKVWEWDSCEVLHTMGGYRNTVAAAAFSPTGRCCGDCLIRWQDRLLGRRLGYYGRGHISPQERHCGQLSPSGDMLATAGLGNIVKVWNMETREVQRAQSSGSGRYQLPFSSGRQLCCLTYEGQIAIYTPESHELLSEGSIDGAPSGSATPIPVPTACSARFGVA